MFDDPRNEFVDRVRAMTDIVQLIGEMVPLNSEKHGRLFTGVCPFDGVSNPHPRSKLSLFVNPERQVYHCGICSEGGDCFSFIMNTERLNFIEAVEYLARRAQL